MSLDQLCVLGERIQSRRHNNVQYINTSNLFYGLIHYMIIWFADT